MAQLVHFLVLAAVCCTALEGMPIPEEIPKPEEGERFRRGPEDSWPDLYPSGFFSHGGTYSSDTDGLWVTTGNVYNNRPVYRDTNNKGWSIYYRNNINKWVRDFNDVSEEWSGTVGIQSKLFASEVCV